MATITPDAPEEQENLIDRRYKEGFNSQGLSEREQGNLGGVYARHPELEERREGLRKREQDPSAAAPGGDVKDQEESGGSGGIINNFTGKDAPAQNQSFGQKIKGSFTKKNGAIGGGIIGIVIAAFFGFSMMTLPSLLLLQFGATMEGKFDMQRPSMLHRTSKVLTAKFRGELPPLTSGSCKAACHLGSFSDSEFSSIEKAIKDAGGKVNKGEMSNGRVKINSIELDGGKVKINSANIASAFEDHPSFKEAFFKHYDPKFAGWNDSLASKVLGKLRIRKNSPFKEGMTDEERKAALHEETKNGSDLGSAKGEYGFDEEKGGYVDEEGELLDDQKAAEKHNRSIQAANEVNETAGDIASSKEKVGGKLLNEADDALEGGLKAGAKGVAKRAGQLLGVFGAVDLACSVYNGAKAVGYGAKIIRGVQMARLAAVYLSIRGKIMAGDAVDPEEISYLAGQLTKTVAKQEVDKYGKLTTITSKSATDSYGYRYAAYNDGGQLTASASEYLAGAGFGGKLTNTLNQTTKIIGGDSSRSGLDKTCNFVGNPWVQGVSIAGGLALLAIPGGQAVFTAKEIAVGTALALVSVAAAVLPGMLADIAAGVLVDGDTYGEAIGDAVTSGSGYLMSTMAGQGGNAPLKPDQAVAYTKIQNQIVAKEAEEDRLARSPFDLSSPNTFLGKMAVQLLPLGSQTSFAGFANTSLSILTRSFASIVTPKAFAEDSVSQFTQCQDPDYQELGVATDPFCNIWRGIPQEYLDIEPKTVLSDLQANGDLDRTGDPTSQYKEYIDMCIDREQPLGDTSDGAKDGSDCFIDSRIKAERYIYMIDLRVVDGMENGYDLDDCIGDGSISGSGATMSESDLKSAISSYGLPAPDEARAAELAKHLQDDPDAAWASKAILAGEKTAKIKGFDVKEYLTTAWLWFESSPDGSHWADPYAVNCNDNRIGYASNVSFICNVTNFQIAGYQAATRSGDYVDVFKKLYLESELPSVMKKVVENSSKTQSNWSYQDSVQKNAISQHVNIDNLDSVTLGDIAPNKSFNDPKAQILTLILGKDPAMVAALNSFAVSDDDLVPALKGSGYGYIGAPQKQMIADMMLALYKIDDGKGATGAMACTGSAAGGAMGSGEGLEAIWGGKPENPTMYVFGPNSDNGLYGYGVAYGLNGLQHSGTDILLDPEAPIYSPVAGTVRCSGTGKGPGTDGGGCSAFNDYFGHGNGRIEIELDNGDVLILGHTSTSLVEVGQRVKPNQQVGTNGGMNSWHVHVEYRIKDPSTSSGWRIIDPGTALQERVTRPNDSKLTPA